MAEPQIAGGRQGGRLTLIDTDRSTGQRWKDSRGNTSPPHLNLEGKQQPQPYHGRATVRTYRPRCVSRRGKETMGEAHLHFCSPPCSCSCCCCCCCNMRLLLLLLVLVLACHLGQLVVPQQAFPFPFLLTPCNLPPLLPISTIPNLTHFPSTWGMTPAGLHPNLHLCCFLHRTYCPIQVLLCILCLCQACDPGPLVI